jgi:Flp pilus assembly protein TadG
MNNTRSKHHQALAHSPRARRVAAARNLAAEEQGGALLEFALVLPILLAVVFGIAQFGLAFNSANDETHIANEVARYAVVNEDPSAKGSLAEWGKEQLDSNALAGEKVCISYPNGTNIGNPVVVTVEGTLRVDWFTILKPLTATAYMRLETAPTNIPAGCTA